MVGLRGKSDEGIVHSEGWIKITSDNRLCRLERNVFSSFPEKGLKWTSKKILTLKYSSMEGQAPVVQRADNAIQQIKVSNMKCTIHRIGIYSVDSVIDPSHNQDQ